MEGEFSCDLSKVLNSDFSSDLQLNITVGNDATVLIEQKIQEIEDKMSNFVYINKNKFEQYCVDICSTWTGTAFDLRQYMNSFIGEINDLCAITDIDLLVDKLSKYIDCTELSIDIDIIKFLTTLKGKHKILILRHYHIHLKILSLLLRDL